VAISPIRPISPMGLIGRIRLMGLTSSFQLGATKNGPPDFNPAGRWIIVANTMVP
jgi:hypothetical protein